MPFLNSFKSQNGETKSRVFIGLTVFSVIIIATFMFSLSRVLESWMLERHIAELQRVSDVTITNIIRVGGGDDEMDLIADSIGLASEDMRVSIFDKAGLLLGDSEIAITDVSQISEGLAERDVNKIKDMYFWSDKRFDKRLNKEMLSSFRYFNKEGYEGIIKISTPVTALNSSIDYIQFVITMFALIAIFYEIAVVVVFARTINSITRTEREHLEQKVNLRTKEISHLQRFTSMLAACHRLSEVEKTAAEVVPQIIGQVPCSISLYNDKENNFESKISWGGEWPGQVTYEAEECWALRKGRYHLSQIKTANLTCNHMNRDLQSGCICVPIVAQAKTFGVLHVLLDIDEYDAKLDIIFTLAESFSLALATINLQKKLKRQAILDPLTQLFNRRQFDEVFDTEINRCKRHATKMSLLLLDIDHFKKLNDKFGHDAGDFVLKEFAATIKNNVRMEDFCFRIGGEEFVVLLPNLSHEEATLVAQKLIYHVNQHRLVFNNDEIGQLGVSIGISCFGEHGTTAKAILKCADLALYEAKESGRNQFVVAHSAIVESVRDSNITPFTKKS